MSSRLAFFPDIEYVALFKIENSLKIENYENSKKITDIIEKKYYYKICKAYHILYVSCVFNMFRQFSSTQKIKLNL